MLEKCKPLIREKHYWKMINKITKALMNPKAAVRRLLGIPYVHLEIFYKSSLASKNPGLTGWFSLANIQLRVVISDREFVSEKIARPDVPNAFYIGLPDLQDIQKFTVEYSAGRGWKDLCRFERTRSTKSEEPGSNPKKDFQTRLNKAVLIHAYYADVLQKFNTLLVNIKHPFDVFIFIPENSPAHQKYLSGELSVDQYQRVIIGRNIGRDMGGFLQLMLHIAEKNLNYDAYLFLQTKKSPQFPENMGDAWRNMLTEPLIGSADAVDNALYQLFRLKKYSLVACSDFLQHFVPEAGKGNYSRYLQVSEIFNIPLRETDFIAGTMFWLKSEHFRNFFTLDRLEKAIALLETGNTPDPSYAHTWERFIGRLATTNAGELKLLDFPAAFERKL